MISTPPTMAVYKYELEPPPGPSGVLVDLELPKGATILKIAAQGEKFFLWALVCLSVEETVKRKWMVTGTGHKFSAKALVDIALISAQGGRATPYEYQETALALNGRLVFHFWVSYPML